MGHWLIPKALDRAKKMLERSKSEAKLIVGGGQVSGNGCFIEPTVFVDPNPDTQILHEEVFGPVSGVQTF